MNTERMQMFVKDLMKVSVYDKESGNFICKRQVGNRRIGDEMGFVDRGIRKVQVNGIVERVHRVVFFIETGRLARRIRHINGNRLDNRTENLREISQREAVQKRERMRSDNASGICRLFYRKSKAGWYCGVRIDGKYKERRIKCFENAEQECKDFLKQFNGKVFHLTKETDAKFAQKQKKIQAKGSTGDYLSVMDAYNSILLKSKEFQKNKGAELWEFNEKKALREIAVNMKPGELIILKEILK